MKLYYKTLDGQWKEIPKTNRNRTSYRDKLLKEYDVGNITQQEMIDKFNKHEEKLEKKRKYKKGEVVTSIDELLSCDFVYIYEKLWHKKWVINLQLGLLVHWITHNRIRKAIKKGE